MVDYFLQSPFSFPRACVFLEPEHYTFILLSLLNFALT